MSWSRKDGGGEQEGRGARCKPMREEEEGKHGGGAKGRPRGSLNGKEGEGGER